ncbi:MAG: hypothetical protein ACJAZB_000355 [Psychrosphaera sp.]|jgi:hypothetical protein|uniref:TonB-dependent receptor n=1 Tax=Psychrosphaera aquimarina TaxID=2044854 RepID=A0ABU3QX44_9GAMM|nr:TonB-dependent receptor [Psychrosphaera aquimarina]MDU0112006.1 TonB-dependent receptor [Psychrosphaera aquimarina]
MKTHRLSLITGAVVLALGLSTSVMANTTTSAIKGVVNGPQGNAAIGTKVTITHVPSGTTKNAIVNASGIFTAKGLRVGGPYKVTLDSDTFLDKEISDVFLTLGETMPLYVDLDAASDLETIVVTGRPVSSFSSNSSPSSHFTSDDLASAPAINRDLKDIVRVDPRVYVDDSRDGAIQCGGGSPRFNSLTLDGVRMNDGFGLNDNGYPTTRVPFSYDSIDQVSVELAPFDVTYGSFTACNINAVTKSGTNEIHGGVFMDYSNDSLKGDSIEGEDFIQGDFTEKRYGFHIGLPLINDELFLFTSYEKLDGNEIFVYNGDVSDADIARVQKASQDLYGYDAGGMPANMPVEDEKLLVKLDWNISDDHRASFIYNYNDGFKLDQSDSWGRTFDSHFYEKGAELTSIVASLHSDWSDELTTEVRIGSMELDNRQKSLDAASGMGEVQIYHGSTTIFLGPDDSRQSNELYWDNFTAKFLANYYLESHTITAGYEYESLTAYNLFMQHTQGEFRFYSIEDFEAGLAGRIYYNNSAGTSNPEDASQEFTYNVHTMYLQDEYTFDDIDATVTFGFRHDYYTSDDKPRYNAGFEADYGFANNTNLDGISLFQPRIGFKWSVDDNLDVRAGMGLYSGGNPNVWVSNSYSNDGLVQVAAREYNVNLNKVDGKVDLFNNPMVNNGKPLFEVPQAMYDYIDDLPVEGGSGAVNAIDPDLELPAEWKYSLGATYITDDNYIFTADLLINKKVNSAIITDAGIAKTTETAPDGRPMYEEVLGGSGTYVLANSNKDGQSTVLSLGMQKEFDFGLKATFGYSYTDSEDANPMTSSTAGSNYGNLAVSDATDPLMTTSNYEIPNRFTMSLSYKLEETGTRFSLFGSASEGQPYSYTYSNSDDMYGDDSWNGSRQLIYVPEVDDSKVVYTSNFDKAAFDAFIADRGLERGAISGRNSQNAEWQYKLDLKISQSFSGFSEGHTFDAFVIVKNLGNLINDEWGITRQGAFVGNRMIEASINESGQYVYDKFYEDNAEEDIYVDGSLWEVVMGVNYRF